MLLAPGGRTDDRGAGRRPRSDVQGPRRPGPSAADLDDRVDRLRSVRVRAVRRLRVVPADDQPPSQGAARSRAGRQRAARHLGVLPGPPRGAAPALRPARHRPRTRLTADVGGRARAVRLTLPRPGRSLTASLARRAFAEAIGTAFLVAAVIGAGIAATRLSADPGLQLLENALVTGAALVALIL